jgi:hypothetical protein
MKGRLMKSSSSKCWPAMRKKSYCTRVSAEILEFPRLGPSQIFRDGCSKEKLRKILKSKKQRKPKKMARPAAAPARKKRSITHTVTPILTNCLLAPAVRAKTATAAPMVHLVRPNELAGALLWPVRPAERLAVDAGGRVAVDGPAGGPAVADVDEGVGAGAEYSQPLQRLNNQPNMQVTRH